jgi:acetyl esterase
MGATAWPLDMAAADVLQTVKALTPTPLSRLTPEEARRAATVWSRFMPERPHGVTATRVATSGPHGLIPMTALSPPRESVGVVVYLHGGGWTVGSADLVEPLCAELCAQAGADVLLVDYRLAPEHPYPVAVDEAVAAVEWAGRRFPGRPLALAGESSGAALAVSAALRLRDSVPIDAQLLLNPALDPRMDSSSFAEHGDGPDLTREAMAWFWRNYLGARITRPPAEAAPLGAAELRGMPPAVVVTAEIDPLRDEGERYAATLRTSEVPVASRRCAAQSHSLFWMAGRVPAALEALRWAAERLREALDGAATDRWS